MLNGQKALLLFDNNGLGFFAKEYIGHVLVIVIAIVFIEGLRRGRRSRKLASAATAAASPDAR